MKRKPHRSGLRLWLVPMAILGGIALLVFVVALPLDHHVTGGISDADIRRALPAATSGSSRT